MHTLKNSGPHSRYYFVFIVFNQTSVKKKKKYISAHKRNLTVSYHFYIKPFRGEYLFTSKVDGEYPSTLQVIMMRYVDAPPGEALARRACAS